MKNYLVFEASGYDMVVAVTQKTLNDQISTLCNPDIGIIKTSLIAGMKPDPATKTYKAVYYESFDDVPKDAAGTPKLPLLNASYMPSVSVEQSGTVAHLNLNFTSGTAWFRDPFSGELEASDMTGWIYSIAINLDFAGIEREDIDGHQPVPDIVKNNLDNFNSNGFKISQLFLDFESVDLMQFDPTKTSAGKDNPLGSPQHQSFVYFMASFLGYLKEHPKENPYILGYTITLTDATTDPDKDVPKSLKPKGQTFNVFKDPDSADRNNINFIINTWEGQANLGQGKHQTPGNFDQNWLGPNEQCDAKMIYSRFCLFETLVFKPFFKAFKEGCSSVIADHLSHTDKDYNCTVVEGVGLSFVVSDNPSGDEQYVNKYNVTFQNGSTTCTLNFSGEMDMYKYVSKTRICDANAWGKQTTKWTSQMVVAVELDDKHQPTLKLNSSAIKIESQTRDSWENDCAKAWSVIGAIIGGFLDALTLGLDNGFFTKLFDDLLSVSPPGLPNAASSFSGLGASANNAFMFPGGQVFFFKNASSDTRGNLAVELTYKTETSGATPVPTQPPLVKNVRPSITDHDVIFTDGPHGRLAKLKNPLPVPPRPAGPTDPSKDKPPKGGDKSHEHEHGSDCDCHHHHHHHHSRSRSRNRSRSRSRTRSRSHSRGHGHVHDSHAHSHHHHSHGRSRSRSRSHSRPRHSHHSDEE